MLEWNVDEVASWLKHIGLSEHSAEFKKNHITGKNLMDLNDNDLREDLKVSSVGHRKDFMKSVEHLKKMLKSDYRELLKQRIMSFYQRNAKMKSSRRLSGLRLNTMYNSLGAPKSGLSQYISSEIIDEENDEDHANEMMEPRKFHRSKTTPMDEMHHFESMTPTHSSYIEKQPGESDKADTDKDDLRESKDNVYSGNEKATKSLEGRPRARSRSLDEKGRDFFDKDEVDESHEKKDPRSEDTRLNSSHFLLSRMPSSA